MAASDLHVATISRALTSKKVHVIVSGSIGAVESVRFIRALRRLGATVQPVLTPGGAQFITADALTWAAASATITNYSGDATHIADGDACVVAPASANFIAKIAQGIADQPGHSLVLSYLGQKKPVIVLPSMHDSLLMAPPVQQNLTLLGSWAHILEPRQEEGKQKFPNPRELADQVAHLLNRSAARPAVLVAMGTTRGYIDDVRYISNYSSGRLGTAISEELYRSGNPVHVVTGPVEFAPSVYSSLRRIETVAELQQACHQALNETCDALVMAASVLDYEPEVRLTGKLKSRQPLSVNFKPTPKIIRDLHPRSGIKVGFKLESGTDPEQDRVTAQSYFDDYGLSLLVMNHWQTIGGNDHPTILYQRSGTGTVIPGIRLQNRHDLACALADHVHTDAGKES